MRYGLIGEKLGHSFSKLLHEQLADYTYDLIPLTKEELTPFLKQKDFAALNVTIPYKETVIPYLDEIDPLAKAIGAVNTIVNRNGKLYGYNTDFQGFRYQLEENEIPIAGKKVLVLGKGGASKAVIAVLRELGAAEIVIVYYKEAPNTVTYAECYEKHTDAEIIVNTTPVGMYPHADACPIDLSHFPKLAGVADIVYNPLRTQLIVEAKKRGIPTAGGLEMLIAQAKYAAEFFLDTKLSDTRIGELHTSLLQDRMNLVLIGMSGCGKTTLGKQLAEALGKTFIDTDTEIIKRTGMSVADYFAKYGEAKFREVETEVIHEFSTQNRLILSTGGGVVKNPLNIDYLQRNGRIIWLDRNADSLESGKGRPLAPTHEAALKLYEERLPLYTAAAEVIIENNGTEAEGFAALLAAFQAK